MRIKKALVWVTLLHFFNGCVVRQVSPYLPLGAEAIRFSEPARQKLYEDFKIHEGWVGGEKLSDTELDQYLKASQAPDSVLGHRSRAEWMAGISWAAILVLPAVLIAGYITGAKSGTLYGTEAATSGDILVGSISLGALILLLGPFTAGQENAKAEQEWNDYLKMDLLLPKN